MAIDLERVAASALDSFLRDGSPESDGRQEDDHRLGGVGALALGVAVAVAARAAFNRARNLDLEQVAGAVEERLKS